MVLCTLDKGWLSIPHSTLLTLSISAFNTVTVQWDGLALFSCQLRDNTTI